MSGQDLMMSIDLTSRRSPQTVAPGAAIAVSPETVADRDGGRSIDRRRLLLGGLATLATAGTLTAASSVLASPAHAAGVGNVLGVGQQLNPGERITSPNGGFFFIQQGDGNAVLYTAAGVPLWTTRSNGKPGAFFANQSDGNLVCYTPGYAPGYAWTSGTNGRGAGDLVLQDDGNLVRYGSSAGWAWASGTDGGRSNLASATGVVAGLSNRADAVVAFVRAQKDKLYLLGGIGPDRYDCSGLAWAAYNSIGVSIPRTSYTQININNTPVRQQDLRPGDLVFPYANASHVGIYTGNGNMVDAPGTNRKIIERAIWQFATARRVL